MSLIVSFRLASPDLPLMSALASVPEMRLEVEHEYVDGSGAPTVFAWADGDEFAPFERRVDADPAVSSFDVLDGAGERRLYRFSIAPDADVVMSPAGVAVGASQLSVVATHRGLEVEQRFTDREALSEYRELCRERGVEFSVRRIYRSDGRERPGADAGASAGIGSYGLSEKQRATLRRAVSEGYYAVPREVELRELAPALGVSRQATSERLRRGVASLVRNTIGAE